jgi:drug/metabolite transporter (DMT)-like permease
VVKRHERRRGLASVHIAVLFFGLAGVLGKLTGLPAPLIVLGRVVFASLALGAVARARHIPLAPRRRRDLAVLAAQGVLLALHWTVFFQSINVASVAVGLLSFSTFPLFTAAIEPALLRQRPSAAQLAAAVAILPGVYLLVPSFSLDNRVTAGVAWGLAAAATFALLSVSNRWLRRTYASVTISLYQDSTAALVLLPTLLLLHPATLIQPRTLALLLALGLLCTALAHTLFIDGLGSVSAQAASLIASLEPVWGIVFALALLGEAPATRTLAGGAIIVAATALPALWRQRNDEGAASKLPYAPSVSPPSATEGTDGAVEGVAPETGERVKGRRWRRASR